MQKSLLGRVLEHQRKMLEYQLGHIESLSSLIQDLDEDIKKNRIYKLGN
jgi:phytoene/squalene synthetase